jgi:hypothetical protein
MAEDYAICETGMDLNPNLRTVVDYILNTYLPGLRAAEVRTAYMMIEN